MKANNQQQQGQHATETIDMCSIVEFGVFGSPNTPTEISHIDCPYATHKTLKELELRQSDYYAYPECISLRTICESMLLSTDRPYMWTIQQGNYTNKYLLTYEMPYLIAKTPDRGLFVSIYRDLEHQYNIQQVNYNNGQKNRRKSNVYKALIKVLDKWRADIPQLTIYTLLNAYDSYVSNPATPSDRKKVSRFATTQKKAVMEYVRRAYN